MPVSFRAALLRCGVAIATSTTHARAQELGKSDHHLERMHVATVAKLEALTGPSQFITVAARSDKDAGRELYVCMSMHLSPWTPTCHIPQNSGLRARMLAGIHTKVAQVVAVSLGCPLDHVRVADTNTEVFC